MANITGTAKKAKVAKGVIDKVEDFFNHKDKAGKGAATATNAANAQNTTNAANVVTGTKQPIPPTSANTAADATKTSANIPNATAKPQQQSPFDAAKDQLAPKDAAKKPDTPNAADNTQQPATTPNNGAAQQSSAQDNAANNQTQNTPDAGQPAGGSDTTTPSTDGASGAAAGGTAAGAGGAAAAGGAASTGTAATGASTKHATGLKGKMDNAKAAAQAKVDGVKNAAQAKVDGVKNAVNGKVDAAKGAVNGVKDKASNAINTIKDPKAIAGNLAAGVAGKMNGSTAKILKSAGIGAISGFGALGVTVVPAVIGGSKKGYDYLKSKREENLEFPNNKITPRKKPPPQKQYSKKTLVTIKSNEDPKEFITLDIKGWPETENDDRKFYNVNVKTSTITNETPISVVSFHSDVKHNEIKNSALSNKDVEITVRGYDEKGNRKKPFSIKGKFWKFEVDLLSEESKEFTVWFYPLIYYTLHISQEFEVGTNGERKPYFETNDKCFNNKTLIEVFDDVFKHNKIAGELYTLPEKGKFTKTKHEQIKRGKETDWNFLTGLCERDFLTYWVGDFNENERQKFIVKNYS